MVSAAKKVPAWSARASTTLGMPGLKPRVPGARTPGSPHTSAARPMTPEAALARLRAEADPARAAQEAWAVTSHARVLGSWSGVMPRL